MKSCARSLTITQRRSYPRLHGTEWRKPLGSWSGSRMPGYYWILRLNMKFFALALSLAVWPAFAQLPPSGTLSDRDWQSFRAEVARIETLLTSALDKGTVTYQM